MFGMLFKEFKPKFCYFDFVKLALKLCIIMLIDLLDSNRTIMCVLIALLLFAHYLMIRSQHPFIFYRT
jgi:cell division protein FtsL